MYVKRKTEECLPSSPAFSRAPTLKLRRKRKEKGVRPTKNHQCKRSLKKNCFRPNFMFFIDVLFIRTYIFRKNTDENKTRKSS